MDSEESTNLAVLRAIDRSLRLLLKLKLEGLKGDKSQKEMIVLLHSLGFQAGEIIELLGASATTVHPTLSRARKGSKKR